MKVEDVVFGFGFGGNDLLPKSKKCLAEMIETLGWEETCFRLAWLFGGTEEEAGRVIDDFLSGNYTDDQGVRGGTTFWGDL